MNRRQVLLRFCQFLAASPLLRADKKYSELTELLKQVNVFDFAKVAKAKMDPLAWDYLDEGSDDEASLRANRSRFDNLIIRPHRTNQSKRHGKSTHSHRPIKTNHAFLLSRMRK